MIELKRLQKVYDQQQEAVIKDVTVSIMPGEFFCDGWPIWVG